MVMEYLDGETLTGRIKKNGRLSPAQTIPLMLQVLEALGAAHAAGIVHRDLKPDNIFILPQKGGMRDFIKILDFGVSKFSQTGGEEMNVTRAGAVVGTPYYMSPEQARGNSAVDGRTDIYAMGVLLYQATTGQVPYQAETFNELLFKIVLEVAPPPQTYVPDLDADFAAIIQRAMAREPAQRFQSCAEFRDALLGFQAAAAAFSPAIPDRNTGVGARPPATQVLDMSQLPQAPQAPQPNAWQPRPSVEPTLPMEPSPLAGGRASNTPYAPAPMQTGTAPSAASWGNASGAGQPLAQPMATSNAWGNASASGTAPRSMAPVVVGVIGLMIVLGGGLGVGAYLLFGKSTPPAAAAGAETGQPVPSSAPSTSAAASALPSAAPSVDPTVEPTAAVTTTPSAAPTSTAKPTPVTKPTSTTVVKPPTPTKLPGKPPGKPGKTGSDLGY
jgi:serine/threonine-protein kinase